jgi:hypothetical protein
MPSSKTKRIIAGAGSVLFAIFLATALIHFNGWIQSHSTSVTYAMSGSATGAVICFVVWFLAHEDSASVVTPSIHNEQKVEAPATATAQGNTLNVYLSGSDTQKEKVSPRPPTRDAQEALQTPAPKELHLEHALEERFLAYDYVRGGWDESSEGGAMRSLIVNVKNPVPSPGQRGNSVHFLAAHLTFSAASQSADVDRAYWLRRDENEINLDPGQSCGIVAGSLEFDRWIAHSNPYRVSSSESYFGPVAANKGERRSVPAKPPISLTVSVLRTDQMQTLAQWQFEIRFGQNGRLVVHEFKGSH